MCLCPAAPFGNDFYASTISENQKVCGEWVEKYQNFTP
jgi:hypothetical protein